MPGARKFLQRLSELPIRVDEDGISNAFGAIFDICQRHELTAYDAAYVELSQRKNARLATLDKRLQNAAAKAKLKLFG